MKNLINHINDRFLFENDRFIIDIEKDFKVLFNHKNLFRFSYEHD